MKATTIVAGLRARGVSLAVEGDELVMRGNTTAVTPKVLAAVRRAKPELMALLAVDESEQAAAADTTRCGRCAQFFRIVELRKIPVGGGWVSYRCPGCEDQ